MDKDKTTDKGKIIDKGKTTIITTIVVGVLITLLGSIFSPVFSPLNEIIKDGLLGEPDTNITSAMTFDYNDKKVSKPLDRNESISTRSITFNFKNNQSSKITLLGDFLSRLGIKNQFPYFECSIDGKPFEECMTPKPYANLDTEVDHLFQVRAKSILGNTDKSPDKFYVTTITSAIVEGQIKVNNTRVYPFSEITLDAYKRYPSTNKTDAKGRFLFEEVGKGPHTIDIFYREVNQTQFERFTVAPSEETKKLALDIQNMSPREGKQIENITTQTQNNSNLNYKDTPIEQQFDVKRIFENNIPNPSWTSSNVTSKSENATMDLVQESTIIQRDPLRFSTHISIDAPANILSDIERVEYYLHPTFNPNIMTSFTKENNFSITFTNWGIFNLKAKVFFKDGTVQDLVLPIEKWKLPTIMDLVQESTIIQRDPLRFSTHISIDAPANILSDIERVEYYLHPTFNPNIMTSFTKENNFSITFTNWGIFNLKAKVFFKEGTVQDLVLPIEKWKLPI